MTKKTKNNDPFFTFERKMEMLGIVIMAIAVTFAVSIITYRSEDLAIIKSVDFRTLLDFGQGPALRIQNGLGPLGAYVSHFFVHTLFGYLSIILVAVIFMYGWNIFRHNEMLANHLKALYAVFVMMLVASVMGWVHNEFDAVSADWAGSSGLAIAHILRALTGQYGPVIILGSLSMIALILLVNKDVQTAIDRIKSLKTWFSTTRKEKGKEERHESDTSADSAVSSRVTASNDISANSNGDGQVPEVDSGIPGIKDEADRKKK